MNGKITHYYDFSRIRSYGARYLMIVGSRGTGKTYGAKKIAISNAIKKGEQFIYLRRHRVEQKGRFTFFDDIAHEFPGYEFAVHGNDAVMRMEGDKEMGHHRLLLRAEHVSGPEINGVPAGDHRNF